MIVVGDSVVTSVDTIVVGRIVVSVSVETIVVSSTVVSAG